MNQQFIWYANKTWMLQFLVNTYSINYNIMDVIVLFIYT
jgi:hypothetical protein